ncbi:hypothetical protein ACN4EG_07780 [Alkalinema pantanalense CENA528]|uniref:hypothetical protein n=1 Tax=Alkalinema pantanalense TaxID=1620705 RepID=UPI003D6ECF08
MRQTQADPRKTARPLRAQGEPKQTSTVTPLRARTTVRPLPPPAHVPSWLRSLLQVQQWSVGVTLVLAGSAIVTYGLTIYSQQLWGKEFARLEQFRRNERQLTANSELMKNEIAKNAKPADYGLVPRSTDHLILIKPAPPRPPKDVKSSEQEAQSRPISPVGY